MCTLGDAEIYFKNTVFSFGSSHCVPRAPECEVSSRPYLFAYCLNTYKTMHYARFRPLNLNVALRQCRNRKISLCGRYLNNRRTGKDATKPRTLGLLTRWDTVQVRVCDYVLSIVHSSVFNIS